MSFSPLHHVTHHQLPNGLRILLKEEHASPLISLQAWVRVGSVDEPSSLAGISHVLEHMVFKGTERFAPAEISRWVESLGGSMNAETSREYTHYHIDVPSAGACRAVTLLGELLYRAALASSQWDLERPVILEEIKRRNDDPEMLLYDTLAETVFQEEHLGRPVVGSPATVSAITRQQLVSHYREFYVAKKSLIVAAGDFKPRAMLRWLSAAFKEMPAGSAPAARPRGERGYCPRQVKTRKRVEQAYVAFGFPTPPAVHPDQEPLDVLSTVLGEGRSSHLVRVLREEKKLAYSVSASNLTHEGPGLFAVFAECSPAKRSRFFLAFEDLLKAFARHRLTEAELRRAKNMIENSWLQGMETYHSQASALGLFALEDDLERLRNYLSRIRSLTRGQLDRVIERYFMPNRFSSVVIEP